MASGFKLLTPSGNPKVEKGASKGYWTFILHLAPAKLSGFEVCPMRTTGCSIACLNLAGHGGIAAGGKLSFDDVSSGKRTNKVQEARIRRTKLFFNNRHEFMSALHADIVKAIHLAAKNGLIPVFRLNGTSDLRWESIGYSRFRNIMEAFPQFQFYDYTKIANRKRLPANYHLTFSLADGNEGNAVAALYNGMNVAAVFRSKDTVARYIELGGFMGRPVVNGDTTDLRFLDGTASDGFGQIVALYAKGLAKKDASGFVRD